MNPHLQALESFFNEAAYGLNILLEKNHMVKAEWLNAFLILPHGKG